MTVMPKVLWKNGVRYGSEWQELELGYNYEGIAVYKHISDKKLKVYGFLHAINDDVGVMDTVLFKAPTNFKITGINVDKITFSTLTGYNSKLVNLELVNGNVVIKKRGSTFNDLNCLIGLRYGTVSLSGASFYDGLELTIEKNN